MTSTPSLTTSRTSGARSRLIQARSGALNRPFGRYTISRGRIEPAASLRTALPCRPTILRSPGTANAALTTSTSTYGTRTSVDAAMLDRSV